MLIFRYVGFGLFGLGVVVAAVGGTLAASYYAATRQPPRSQEEEQVRIRLGYRALAVSLIGLLACGVGVLFM
jgi:hypothetical protein